MSSVSVLQALTVAAELVGQELSPTALRVMADDLAAYPEPAVLAAITRVRREVRGRFSLADVISRVDDGRPGAEEAWQMVPRDEDASVVWTDEMAYAAGGIDLDDPVSARMAFLERYRSEVAAARNDGTPVRWWLSPGRDASGRETAVREAVERGRLTHERALQLVPSLEYSGANELTEIVEEATRRMAVRP